MKFLIVDDEHELYKRMYADILHKKDSSITEISNFQDLPLLLNALEKTVFNRRLNRHMKVPFKKLYDKYYTLSSYNWNPDEKYWVLMLNGTLCAYYSEEYLRNFKRTHKNVKLAMVLYDCFANRSAQRAISMISLFDKVFSFDEEDAAKHGLQHIYSTFSTPDYLKTNAMYQSNAFFIGTGADREEELNADLSYIASRIDNCKFGIVGVENQKYKGLIEYNKPISYQEEQMYAYNTNCIVEIVKRGQAGITLRTCEAIVFNKKLLTNNASIKSLPFYDPRYMSVFETAKDIDIDFIRDNREVDYKYDGYFSPRRVIELLAKERW